MRAVALAGVLIVTIAPAWAQSKRYPPEPVDVDQQQRETSKTWDNATHPERTPYRDLMTEARSLDQHHEEQIKAAIAKLGEAIALEPGNPEAYRERGGAYLLIKDWAHCADDFLAADERTPRTDDHARADRRTLGLCQARAGRFAAAEHTLAQAAAITGRDGELWMRLGEVRIAMGKLDEAEAALQAALDATDASQQALIHWFLATAYDRARRPGDADAEVKLATGYDRTFSTIIAPTLPLLGVGEAEYMLGLAYGGEAAKPELELLYFRSFLKLAPDSPWRKRAEEHVKELRAVELPETVEKRGGAPADAEALRNIVRKGMPAMRACLARMPNAVFEVRVTKAGPRTPDDARDRRPRMWAPPSGVGAVLQRTIGTTLPLPSDVDAAARCIEPLAGKLAFPAVKEADSWFVVVFSVIGL